MAKGNRGGSNNTGGNASFTPQNDQLGSNGAAGSKPSQAEEAQAKGEQNSPQENFNETLDKLAKAAMSKEMLAAGLAAAAAAISASPTARRKIRDAGVDAADTATNAATSVMSSASRLGSLIAGAFADAAQKVLSGNYFSGGEEAQSSGAGAKPKAASAGEPTPAAANGGAAKGSIKVKTTTDQGDKPKRGPGRPRVVKVATPESASPNLAKSEGEAAGESRKRAPAKPRAAGTRRASTATAGRRGTASSRTRGESPKKDGGPGGDDNKGTDA